MSNVTDQRQAVHNVLLRSNRERQRYAFDADNYGTGRQRRQAAVAVSLLNSAVNETPRPAPRFQPVRALRPSRDQSMILQSNTI